MTYFRTLSAAGFIATAISYGPGRMGFGLFVPELKAEFDMSASTVGFVSGFGFLGFFAALILAQTMLTRLGPKAPVVTGLASAAFGMAIVAGTTSIALLAIGVFLTSSSAGFAWTPFNDAVNRKIQNAARPTALSLISTGTSIGILLAAAAALAAQSADLSWRVCWIGFAGAAAFAAIANWTNLRAVEPSPAHVSEDDRRLLLDWQAVPLYAVAFVLGAISAIYISFAADYVRQRGPVAGLPEGSGPAALFLIYGVFGLAGLATGYVRDRIGLVELLRVLMATGAMSMVLIVLWPEVWIALIPSAGAQGMAVMMTSAVLAFWSDRLFPWLPSMAFTVALLAYAAGSVSGPALAGIVSDVFGVKTMFLGAAVFPALMAFGLSSRLVRDMEIPSEQSFGAEADGHAS